MRTFYASIFLKNGNIVETANWEDLGNQKALETILNYLRVAKATKTFMLCFGVCVNTREIAAIKIHEDYFHEDYYEDERCCCDCANDAILEEKVEESKEEKEAEEDLPLECAKCDLKDKCETSETCLKCDEYLEEKKFITDDVEESFEDTIEVKTSFDFDKAYKFFAEDKECRQEFSAVNSYEMTSDSTDGFNKVRRVFAENYRTGIQLVVEETEDKTTINMYAETEEDFSKLVKIKDRLIEFCKVEESTTNAKNVLEDLKKLIGLIK